MNILKRNGSIVEFDINKIYNAVKKAMLDSGINNETLSYKITEDTYKDILEDNKDVLYIEDVQDLVESNLMKNGLTDVARSYILYRERRKETRDRQSNLYQEAQEKISDIMNMKDIENSNANVDEGSFSGKNSRVTSHFLKEYALNNLMDKRVAQAHRDGLLYTHDLDNYCSGMHNCLNIDFKDLFENNKGFETRNGDVRKPNNIMTFFQLVAVTFQCQSQVQFGGVGSNKIDYDGAPYVAITFKKCFKDAIIDVNNVSEETANNMINNIEDAYGDIIKLDNSIIKSKYKREYDVAKRHTEKKTLQGAESLYHNLNTLESRAGSQVPFTSINFGTDTSPEGRLVSKALLQASINGIGKFNRTSIFPISIFKYKKGVNDKPGTPNYDLKQLALKSLSKRIYPNFCNVDVSYQDECNSPDEEFATMGCRTLLGYDINGMGWKRGGRGNIAPVTMNLVDLGIRNGICMGERNTANIDNFWKDLDELLNLSEVALLDRYEWICSQKAKSGYFMYKNGTMKSLLGRRLSTNEEVREVMKHNTLALGYIGVAECMKAMFGKHHGEDEHVYEFAYSVVEKIYKFTKELTKKHHLNFSCYATPAESTCMTLRNKLVDKYGVIEGVTDREYITNSHHIPVYYNISIMDKIDKESKFSHLCTGGFIEYVELNSTFMKNLNAIEKIIDYAMSKDAAYFALNFPIDTCGECGYSDDIKDNCPKCGSNNIERLRRVTGYLTTDYKNFNEGKIYEVKDRVKHGVGDLIEN